MLLVDRLLDFNAERLRPIFGERITDLTGEIIDRRREQLCAGALDALRRQYPDYVAALEVAVSSPIRRSPGEWRGIRRCLTKD